MIKALFVARTQDQQHAGMLNRWECPECRKNKKPECRFNLSVKKINIEWKCRFCKTPLFLELPKNEAKA